MANPTRIFHLSFFCIVFHALLLVGCSSWFDYHPYDTRFGGKGKINEKNIEMIENQTVHKDTFRFAFISDSHLWQRDLKCIVSHINNNDSIDFVIHGGDITDCGTTPEYEWTRKILETLNKPYIVVLGNHDCLGSGHDTYNAMFSKEDFSFIAGRVKFICINTNAMEYDYAAPIPDFNFIEHEKTARGEEFDRTILVMHTKPGCEPFNNNLYQIFEWYAMSLPGLMFSLCGHEHSMSITDLYEDGNLYYCAPCSEKLAYFVFTIYTDGYEYEYVRI